MLWQYYVVRRTTYGWPATAAITAAHTLTVRTASPTIAVDRPSSPTDCLRSGVWAKASPRSVLVRTQCRQRRTTCSLAIADCWLLRTDYASRVTAQCLLSAGHTVRRCIRDGVRRTTHDARLTTCGERHTYGCVRNCTCCAPRATYYARSAARGVARATCIVRRAYCNARTAAQAPQLVKRGQCIAAPSARLTAHCAMLTSCRIATHCLLSAADGARRDDCDARRATRCMLCT